MSKYKLWLYNWFYFRDYFKAIFLELFLADSGIFKIVIINKLDSLKQISSPRHYIYNLFLQSLELNWLLVSNYSPYLN